MREKMKKINDAFDNGEAWVGISRVGGGATLFLFVLYLVESLK